MWQFSQNHKMTQYFTCILAWNGIQIKRNAGIVSNISNIYLTDGIVSNFTATIPQILHETTACLETMVMITSTETSLLFTTVFYSQERSLENTIFCLEV